MALSKGFELATLGSGLDVNQSTGEVVTISMDTDVVSEGTTNLYFTNERVDDRVANLLVGGSNITITYDDTAGTLTIAGQSGYSDSDVDTHLNVSGASANQVLAWSGTDYIWANNPAPTGDSNRVVYDLSDPTNTIVLDPGSTIGTATYKGDVLKPDGTVIVDVSSTSSTFTGGLRGNTYGDVYNPTGANKILESGTGNLDSVLTVDSATITTLNATTTNISGIATFTGSSVDFTGTTTMGSWNGPVYDRTGGTLIIEDNASPNPIVHADLDGDVTGTVSSISNHDTGDLTEGSNLYYTDARVGTYIGGDRTYGNITTTGYLRGPSTFTIDPATHGDDTGTLVIAGNLQVDGTTTTINSTTLTVDDKNIVLASGAADSAAANGAGLTVDGASANITYTHATTSWDFNKPVNVTGDIGVTGTVDGVDIATRDGVLTTTTTTANAALPKTGGTMTGNITFNAGQTFPGTGSLSNIVEDTTPQLGGDLDVNGKIITSASSGNIKIKPNGTGHTEFENEVKFIGTSYTTEWLSVGHWSYRDGVQARFGNSDDLKIYHDGSNSYIGDAGTGSLIIEGTNLNLRATDNSRYLVGVDGVGGYTSLYHPDGDSLKLKTTSTGIDVTGNANFSDNGKAIFGAGTDLQIYHDGTNTAIQNSTGELFIYGGSDQIRIRAENGEESIVANPNGSVDLYYDNSEKLATTSYGVDITGRLVTTSHIDAPDNARIRLGDGDDLQIYHDGSNSYVSDEGTGNLTLKANGTKILMETAGGETLAEFINNGNVVLYSNNVERVRTNGTGIDVTGTVKADGLNVDGVLTATTNNLDLTGTAPKINIMESDTTDENAQLTSSGGNFLIRTLVDSKASATTRLKIDHSTGDISFYEGTGTTAKFFWDASAESLGIGTTSPSNKLHVHGGGDSVYSIFARSDAKWMYLHSGGTDPAIGWDTGGSMRFGPATSNVGSGFAEKMRITASGDVGIGTTNPSYKLEIAEDTNGTANLLQLRNSDSTYAQTWLFSSDTSKDLLITGSSGSGGIDLQPGTRGAKVNGSAIWHAGNDGSGSGLDADLLDGRQGSQYVFDGVDNGATDIIVNDADFIVRDTTDGTTNFIWRDHSDDKLYLGTLNAQPITRYDLYTQGGSKYYHAGNDGSGSGLDADKLDGLHASDFTQKYSFNPGSSGGSRKYVKLFTLDDFDDSVVGILSSAGDYGDADRATYQIQIATRTGISFDVYQLSTDSVSDDYEFYYRQDGSSNYEIWTRMADYNQTNTFTKLSEYGEVTYNFDSATTTQPTGLTQITKQKMWHSGNDGSGSGLDADLLDGQHGSYYQKKTTVQDAVPSGATGEFWYESDTSVLHVYYGGAWVDVAPGLQTSDNLQINSLGVGTAASGTAGEIRATNDVTAYYSDARLKNFESTIDSALDKVKQLNGYYFTENETAKELGYANDKRQVGVSAQEVEAVLPEIVTEAPISDEYLTVKYEKLAPLFIEAIKEIDEKYQAKQDQQQAQIDMLMEEIKKLKGN